MLETRPGEHCLIRVSAKDTEGLYSLVEILSDPGDGTPAQIHEREDEHIAVMEGTARIAYGDKGFDSVIHDSAAGAKVAPQSVSSRTLGGGLGFGIEWSGLSNRQRHFEN